MRLSKKRDVSRFAPLPNILKFNVDGGAKGKPGQACIGGALRDEKGAVLCMFCKSIEIRNSNKAEVLAILEALRIFSRSFQRRLIVESNSYNAISWVGSDKGKPLKLHFSFNEIKYSTSFIPVDFCHIIRSANGLVHALEKLGVGRTIPWEVLF